ncbi:outer membrane protein assembly factor [Reichenbachiella agarivorans]|uniref:Outer membrane protein assembly factor n=1 Tax=Reichenbachiella agarivorans TaxID=2979464 RepID=A0ABY6CV96_9BACT|nr:outer membrane protein assembly factor [Reichenbachiella agarivorans]UXP33839.1 outer membrane protein assembly factor [Reichenbachiella agarivorans]
MNTSRAQLSSANWDSVHQSVKHELTVFNKKAELFFQFIPFPIYSYAQETGHVYGLVKYNMVDLVEGDSVSAASNFTVLASLSSKGQSKVILSSRSYFKENKWIWNAESGFIDFPEHLFGIGNEINSEKEETVQTTTVNFVNSILMSKDDYKRFYIGVSQAFNAYYSVKTDSVSFITENQVPGYQGGAISGLGPALIWDTRDHRYNSMKGTFVEVDFKYFTSLIGSDFEYASFKIDFRKFIRPWYQHVIAFQGVTSANIGEVPFYALSQIGGISRMRGYFKGAIRDKVLFDSQVEYRIPVWKIFGAVAFASAGRVAPNYASMALSDLWYGGGLGLRVLVDSKNKANLRLDYGWGQGNSSAFIIGFTEAF